MLLWSNRKLRGPEQSGGGEGWREKELRRRAFSKHSRCFCFVSLQPKLNPATSLAVGYKAKSPGQGVWQTWTLTLTCCVSFHRSHASLGPNLLIWGCMITPLPSRNLYPVVLTQLDRPPSVRAQGWFSGCCCCCSLRTKGSW